MPASSGPPSSPNPDAAIPIRVFPADRVFRADTPRTKHSDGWDWWTPRVRRMLAAPTLPTELCPWGDVVNDLTPVAMAWFAGHHGVITTAELRSRGVGRSTTDGLTRARVLRNPHKGVYVLASAKSTLEVRCAVAVRRTPSGFRHGAHRWFDAWAPPHAESSGSSLRGAPWRQSSERNGVCLPSEHGPPGIAHAPSVRRNHHRQAGPPGLRSCG